MPPSDVRRSARGAPPAVKPPPPASIASSSSHSSNRQDRNARLTTNQKSATPHSLSSEDISEPPRRSQRSHLPKEVEASKEVVDPDEEAIDEEEITRCICGQQEYPGPPLSEAFEDVDTQADDGGLFISCDGCSVWQHGGCVGIIEESKVPDKYYCEECRPKLHELHTDANGQQYSLYQPVHGKSNRKSSTSKHGEKAQRERDSLRASAESSGASGRRRGTMRSKEHDDEEEQFRRAIEESKREIEGPGTGKKAAKRVRDDSEDNKQDAKRQRRASEAAPLNTRKSSHDGESEDDGTTTNLRGKKAKAEAAHSARQADAREKEKEREKSRAEAAGRRQERAGRRRGDDEPAEETPKPTASTKTSPPPSPQPGSPAAEPNGIDKVPGKRGPGKKKKLGNNQYTNKREASSPHGKKRTGGVSSGDENLANGDSHHDSANGTRKNSPDHTTTGKGRVGRGKKNANGNGHKHEDPTDLTMTTMRRRMEAMSAFITRAQLELSSDKTHSGLELGSASPAVVPGGAVQPATARSTPGCAAGSEEKNFKDMSAFEMADVVSKSISSWQTKFEHLA